MDPNLVPMIISVGGLILNLILYLGGRRKLMAEARKMETEGDVNKAEEADTFAGMIQKMITIQDDLQTQNAELYKSNVALEKAKADADRTVETLTLRLERRDAQNTTLSEQLKRLQSRELHNEISNALNTQLAGINEIKSGYEKIIADQGRTIQELMARTGTGPLPDLPAKQRKD